MPGFGLYVHIPFCPQHCPYCAFAVLTGHASWYERYTAAVCHEIRAASHLRCKGPLRTIFFGGGTPSMLAPSQVQRILETATAVLGLAPGAEITMEANPNTADTAKFAAFRALGISRLSLGVQAFHDADLAILGRMHSAAEAERAYAVARAAGFTNVNIDLMFGVPGTPRSHWQTTLQRAVTLEPEHMSAYSLTIEEGTRFARRYHLGRLHPVSEEDDVWAYAYTMQTLASAGYEQYEVSNFARPGFRSRHNWGYWHGAEYLGVGLAAHSFLDGRRRWNLRDLRSYVAALEAGRSACADEEVLDDATRQRERVWLQIRTCAGVQFTAAEVASVAHLPRMQALIEAGLVQFEARRLRLTLQGLPLADAIGVELTDMLDTSVPHVLEKNSDAVLR